MSSSIVEQNAPLRDSVLWQLQNLFYDKESVKAWSDAIVPNFVTSNAFIASCYAKLILGYVREWHGSTGDGSGRGPVYIVEVGTGHGRLTYHVLRHLVSMRDAWPTPAPMAEEVGTSTSTKYKSSQPPFLWVSTDFSSSNIRFLRQHEPLRPLVEAGLLDFAIFDAEQDATLHLQESGKRITSRTVRQQDGAVIGIANYVVDTLRQDALRFEGGRLHQAKLSLVLRPMGPDDVHALALDKRREIERSGAVDADGRPLSEQDALHAARRDPRACAPPPYPLAPGGWHPSVIRRLQHHWSFDPIDEDELAGQLAEHTAGAAAGVPMPSQLQLQRASAPGPHSLPAPIPETGPSTGGADDPQAHHGMEAGWASSAPEVRTRAALRLLGREGPAALVMREYCALAGGTRARAARLEAQRAREAAGASTVEVVAGSSGPESPEDGATGVQPHPADRAAGETGAEAEARRLELLAAEAEREAAALSTSSPMLPVGGLCMASRLLALGSGRLMLLCGDKAFSEAEEMCGRALPHVATHGSFSFMANFHALRLWAEALGGTSLRTEYEDGFKCAAFVVSVGDPRPQEVKPTGVDADSETKGTESKAVRTMDAVGGVLGLDGAMGPAGAGGADAPDTKGVPPRGVLSSAASGIARSHAPQVMHAWDESMRTFGPEQFSAMQRLLRDNVRQPEAGILVPLLRLARHDPDVFFKFRQDFIQRIPFASEAAKEDAWRDAQTALAQCYPLQSFKDGVFELGRVLMGLRRYQAALRCFLESMRHWGEHHVSWFNCGICHVFAGDQGSAICCFDRAVELYPQYDDALAWRRRAVERARKQDDALAAGGVPCRAVSNLVRRPKTRSAGALSPADDPCSAVGAACPAELLPVSLGLAGVWPAASTTVDAVRSGVLPVSAASSRGSSHIRGPAASADGESSSEHEDGVGGDGLMGPSSIGARIGSTGRSGRGFVPEGSLPREWRPQPGELCTVVVSISIPQAAAAAPASDESPLPSTPSTEAANESTGMNGSWAKWDPFGGVQVAVGGAEGGDRKPVHHRHRACLLEHVPLLGLLDPAARTSGLSGTASRAKDPPGLFERVPAAQLEGTGGVWGNSLSCDSFISVVVRVPRQHSVRHAIAAALCRPIVAQFALAGGFSGLPQDADIAPGVDDWGCGSAPASAPKSVGDGLQQSLLGMLDQHGRVSADSAASLAGRSSVHLWDGCLLRSDGSGTPLEVGLPLVEVTRLWRRRPGGPRIGHAGGLGALDHGCIVTKSGQVGARAMGEAEAGGISDDQMEGPGHPLVCPVLRVTLA